jgi:hypothetical protein
MDSTTMKFNLDTATVEAIPSSSTTTMTTATPINTNVSIEPLNRSIIKIEAIDENDDEENSVASGKNDANEVNDENEQYKSIKKTINGRINSTSANSNTEKTTTLVSNLSSSTNSVASNPNLNVDASSSSSNSSTGGASSSDNNQEAENSSSYFSSYTLPRQTQTNGKLDSKSIDREMPSYTTLRRNPNSTIAPSARRHPPMLNSTPCSLMSPGIFVPNEDFLAIDSSTGAGENELYLSADKSCCLECGQYSFLNKCTAHCDLMLCESCQQKHWQIELNELIRMKSLLEQNVADLKKYLSAKKSQCHENIKNSQQIKKFINMTMQQIKRKVELELENKRDELYNSIDAFVENQKKYKMFSLMPLGYFFFQL